MGHATAAANSAFFAAIEANTAFSAASAADSSALLAIASAGDANTAAIAAADSANVASAKATEAGDYAAEALDYSNTAARVSSGGVSKNPVFSAWAANTAEPDNVTIYTWGAGSIGQATTGVRYLNALDLIGGNAWDSGPVVKLGKFAQSLDCSSKPSAVLVRAELELRSGTLDGGAYVSANWTTENGTDAVAKVYLNEQMREETGIVQVVDFYLERPDTYDEGTGWIDFSVELSASEWELDDGTCTLRVHKFDFEEVLAESSTAIYQRSVAQLDGITSAVVGLRAVANTGGAELELVALDSPEGSASVARIAATNIILDGTVTTDHLNASSFSVSGMALFGGTLKSSNYVANSAGWQIKNNGDAEFNSLVVRESNLAVNSTVAAVGVNQGASAQTPAWPSYGQIVAFPTLAVTSGKVLLQFQLDLNGAAGVRFQIRRGSTDILTRVHYAVGSMYQGPATLFFWDSPSAGNYIYSLYFQRNGNGSGWTDAFNCNGIAINFKKS